MIGKDKKGTKGKQVIESEQGSYTTLVDHVRVCKGCAVDVQKTKILENRLHNATTRKLVESYHIIDNPKCISQISLKPTENEILFLKNKNLIHDV